MTISENSDSLKNKINAANPNNLASMLQAIALGDILRTLPTFLRKKNPNALGTNPYDLATLQVIVLPDDAKACSIIRATARAGTATAGELTAKGYGVTPGTGEIAVTPCGNIAVLAADAWTDLDVNYQPEKYDPIELVLPVASNALAIPATYLALGVTMLLEAEALAGTSTGKKIVLVPSASTAAAGQARLDLAKATVKFNGTDAVTSARVKLAISPAIDADALLTAISPF